MAFHIRTETPSSRNPRVTARARRLVGQGRHAFGLLSRGWRSGRCSRLSSSPTPETVGRAHSGRRSSTPTSTRLPT